MKYKAICFDIDGTLYPAQVMRGRLLRMGLRHPVIGIKYNKVRKVFRKGQKDFVRTVPFRWREAMILKNKTAVEPEQGFIEEDYRKEYSTLQNLIYDPMEKLYQKTKAIDGVAQTLGKIKNNGLKIGVFTDFPLFHKLQTMNLYEYVDFCASSDDVGFLKPDTHCFEYLLYNLKVEPQDVLYVGDSYAKDIVGASKAGIDAVLVNVKTLKGRSRFATTAKTKYPLAKAVFSRWKDFDAWLDVNIANTATMEDLQ